MFHGFMVTQKYSYIEFLAINKFLKIHLSFEAPVHVKHLKKLNTSRE